MTKMIGKKIIIGIIVLVVLASIVFIYIQNNTFTINNILYQNSKVPLEFNGYKIVQVSDLHNKKYGKNQSILIKKIKAANPNIIVVTGDLIHSCKHSNSYSFIEQAVTIAPTYYVTGNHEQECGFEDDLRNKLMELNVIILDNEFVTLNHNGADITLMGMEDLSNFGESENFVETLETKQTTKMLFADKLEEVKRNTPDRFTILLSHRPELYGIYVDNKIDLTFSGHAHGGQIRLPFIGPVFSPNQGFFPKYTAGLIKGDYSMIVSRGMGSGNLIPRLFNRPELIVCELSN